MGLIFYNFFLFLYRTGILLISPWNPKAKLWIRGRQHNFETIRKALHNQQASKLIWMHCASLGEFEQGRPVLEHIKATNPSIRIVLTFFSASGYEIRKNYPGADHIFYLPMDSQKNAKQFIDIVKPDLVLWVKYEYWYHYLAAINKQQIPLLLISAIFRKDQVFFKWYGNLHRKMLTFFSQLFVQNEESKHLLNSIGFTKNITISGDTRFDRVIEIAGQFRPIPSIEAFCSNHDVIVAGSTWQEDEEELDHFANTHPEIKFLIAPHEIDMQHLSEVKKLFHHSILLTDWERGIKDQAVTSDLPVYNVLIIDNIGMLSRLYNYATIAYIGGGFGDDGVHNVLEAAVFGKPVVFGPVYDKFIEATELVECGGAFSIDNALELEEVLNVLLKSKYEQTKASESSKAYVYLKKGAEEKIVNYIIEKNLF